MRSFLAASLFGGAVYAAPHTPSQPSHWGPPGGYGPGSGSPTVSVKNGTVSGVHSSTYNQDFFLGIPFAQPPVNELRFRNPQPINTTFSGTYAATEYAPICVGYGGDDLGYPVSEDCLYLNVVRPSGYEGQKLPVGVWIHGGGLVMGGTQDKRYNQSFIVQNSVDIGKPIIGVSIAYRLSAWGFLASQEVQGSGNTNIGLRDQRLALAWLQENIEAFGGDASKVTIWGESAGAGSVGWHLTAYNGRDDGLFRAGIMESGNPINYNSYQTLGFFQPLYNQLLQNVSCWDAIDNLDCLRHVPYETLNAALNTTNSSAWQPIVDGDFIARWSSIQLAEGDFVHVPIIDGANSDEGTSFGPPNINTTADFVKAAVGRGLPSQFTDDLLAAYPDTCAYYIPQPPEVPCDAFYGGPAGIGGEAYRRSAAYFGDVVMIANRRGTCETWAANDVPAYCYRFNTIPTGATTVAHFQEVAFVFDNVNGLGYDELHGTVNPFANKSASYTDLAKLMSSSWASFIYDLDPNGFNGRHAGTPDWPVYSTSTPQDFVLDANVTELAYAEADTYRQAGIQFILDHAKDYHR